MKDEKTRIAASFRDPSGFVFSRDGEIFRQVNRPYQENYDEFMRSGLYRELVDQGLLIPHEETDDPAGAAYKILRPEPIPFISYPYEWCFSALKDAARVTLLIQKIALQHGMSLKDASAFNIQFRKGRPVLIDTLSFEKYREGEPWVAYRQFCEHFLAPLSLMACLDLRLGRLLQSYMDGIPLDFASRLMPLSSWLNPSLALHLHLHARAQIAFQGETNRKRSAKFNRHSILGLIDSLESAVRGLKPKRSPSGWLHYYEETFEGDVEEKKRLLEEFLEWARPAQLWDFGANTGEISRIASRRGVYVAAFDFDPTVVEQNYQKTTGERIENLLPLVLDLANPSPGAGWANQERLALTDRGPVDAIVALGLIHHLAITHYVPLRQIAGFFSGLSRHLMVEFIPPDDPKAKSLIASREAVFSNYHESAFQEAFSHSFEIIRNHPLKTGGRRVYFMKSLSLS